MEKSFSGIDDAMQRGLQWRLGALSDSGEWVMGEAGLQEWESERENDSTSQGFEMELHWIKEGTPEDAYCSYISTESDSMGKW